MLLFTNARYGSAGVKANVTIKTDGDTVEIVDNDVEMNNNSYKNLPSNDDDNDGDINTTTTNKIIKCLVFEVLMPMPIKVP